MHYLVCSWLYTSCGCKEVYTTGSYLTAPFTLLISVQKDPFSPQPPSARASPVMNVSRKDLYNEEPVEEETQVDNEAQAMLEKMLSAGWSNAVDTQEVKDEQMDQDHEEQEKESAEPDMHCG